MENCTGTLGVAEGIPSFHQMVHRNGLYTESQFPRHGLPGHLSVSPFPALHSTVCATPGPLNMLSLCLEHTFLPCSLGWLLLVSEVLIPMLPPLGCFLSPPVVPVTLSHCSVLFYIAQSQIYLFMSMFLCCLPCPQDPERGKWVFGPLPVHPPPQAPFSMDERIHPEGPRFHLPTTLRQEDAQPCQKAEGFVWEK